MHVTQTLRVHRERGRRREVAGTIDQLGGGYGAQFPLFEELGANSIQVHAGVKYCQVLIPRLQYNFVITGRIG